MRAPLTPLKAFVHDAASLGRAGTTNVSDDSRLTQWLAVAQAAERLANLDPDQRSEYATILAARVLPVREERPTQIEGDGRAPTDPMGKLGERLRLEAEDMERAGCFELARTTVSFVCQMLTRAPITNRLLATAHLGRVNRQIGDLEGAVDCYSTVTEQGQKAKDGPVAAHGFIGLGNVAHARGNRPAQKGFFEQALGLAAKGSPVELSAHQGLMITANQQGHLADALLHGWRAHDLAPPESEFQLGIVGNLAQTAFNGGFYAASLAGNLHVLQFSKLSFNRLPGLGMALRGAAHLGRRDELDRLQSLGDAEPLEGAAPFDVARFKLWSAEAWKLAGETSRIQKFLADSLALADEFGFHELRIRAESVGQADIAPARPSSRPSKTSTAENPIVREGIGRLESLALV